MVPMNQGSSGDADTENGLVDTVGEGQGGMNGEAAWRHIHYHMENSHRDFAVWLRELKPVLRDNLEGWEVRGRGHKYTYGWCVLMCGRYQHNIVK